MSDIRIWKMLKALEDLADDPSQLANLVYDGVADWTFTTKDGWSFEVFFDCGDPDYLNWIRFPTGEVFDFWGGNTSWVSCLATNLILGPVGPVLLALAKKHKDWDYGD
ncbi:hypothetical protein LCGC14_1740730 [marine sediment metagenome]|uniref:Uncharacterized protein n=1 Tax=marine sediment metagenome TaxID=412755 RepID=A0A0F9JM21_9ZZZZ